MRSASLYNLRVRRLSMPGHCRWIMFLLIFENVELDHEEAKHPEHRVVAIQPVDGDIPLDGDRDKAGVQPMLI